MGEVPLYRFASLIRRRIPLGPYGGPTWGAWLLMSEVRP